MATTDAVGSVVVVPFQGHTREGHEALRLYDLNARLARSSTDEVYVGAARARAEFRRLKPSQHFPPTGSPQ